MWPLGLNATELTEVLVCSLLSSPDPDPGSCWGPLPRSFHAVVPPIAASPVPPAAIRNRRRDQPTVVVGGLKVTGRCAELTSGWGGPPGKAAKVLL